MLFEVDQNIEDLPIEFELSEETKNDTYSHQYTASKHNPFENLIQTNGDEFSSSDLNSNSNKNGDEIDEQESTTSTNTLTLRRDAIIKNPIGGKGSTSTAVVKSGP